LSVFGYCIVVSLTAFVLFVIKHFTKYTLCCRTHLTTLSHLLAVGGVTYMSFPEACQLVVYCRVWRRYSFLDPAQPDSHLKWPSPTRPDQKLTWNSGPDPVRPIFVRLSVVEKYGSTLSRQNTLRPKKEVTWCLIITLADVHRFSKFFRQLIPEN